MRKFPSPLSLNLIYLSPHHCLLLCRRLLLLLLHVVVAGAGDGGRLEGAVRVHHKADVTHHGREAGDGAVGAVRS
jgi:hypothetical protein